MNYGNRKMTETNLGNKYVGYWNSLYCKNTDRVMHCKNGNVR